MGLLQSYMECPYTYRERSGTDRVFWTWGRPHSGTNQEHQNSEWSFSRLLILFQSIETEPLAVLQSVDNIESLPAKHIMSACHFPYGHLHLHGSSPPSGSTSGPGPAERNLPAKFVCNDVTIKTKPLTSPLRFSFDSVKSVPVPQIPQTTLSPPN